MRKKFALIFILLLSAFAGLLSACAKKDGGYALIGFEPKSEITVSAGDFVETETMFVSDTLGNYYDVS